MVGRTPLRTPAGPAALGVLILGGVLNAASFTGPQGDAWQRTFNVTAADLATTGENQFFILKPGHQLTLEGRESGKTVTLVVTVLDETRVVGGIEARVVEERESENGALVEVSRNFVAIHRTTRDVYYLGEEVDIYRNGKIVDHEGAWLSGVNGARFGLMMPGTPLLGAKYLQEIAPKVAMDRAEIVSLTETLQTPAGKFERCLKTEESSAIEGGKEYKVYAPGIGLILSDNLKLTKHGRAGQ